MTDAISIKINYKDFEYPFAANPYALVCFDGNGNFNADYWVSFTNEASPHNEVRFVRECDFQECFVLQLSELPSAIKKITVFVFGLIWYPSDLVVTITNQDEDIISCMTISGEEIKGKRGFSVVNFTYDGTWNYDMRIELISEAELNKILEKEKPCLDTYSSDAFNYGQICGDRVKGINSCTQDSSEQTFRDIIDKYNKQWDDIMEDVDEYYDQLDELADFCRDLEESRQTLERVDWSKVSAEKREEVLVQVQESIDTAKARKRTLEAHFHQLCDSMEEVIFSLSSYKKQNKYFEEKVLELVADKLYGYKSFAETVKDRFGFERSEEQKARRTERLKQWE